MEFIVVYCMIFRVDKCDLKLQDARGQCQGGCFTKKRASYHLGVPICKDKTVSQPSYLYYGNPYTWNDGVYIGTKPRILWWIRGPDINIYKALSHLQLVCNLAKKTVIYVLTHWGQVTHICVGNLTIIGSDDGLSPGRRQAIIWTNAGISLIGPIGTNFSEILAEIITFSFKKMYLKVSSAKWRPLCLGLNVSIKSHNYWYLKPQRAFCCWPLHTSCYSNQKYIFAIFTHHCSLSIVWHGPEFHWYPRQQSSWGQHGAHLGPVGPSWAPCWPHEPCSQGCQTIQHCQVHWILMAHTIPLLHTYNTCWNSLIYDLHYVTSTMASYVDAVYRVVQHVTWCGIIGLI